LSSTPLTPHFNLEEFKCPCCGQVNAAAALQLAKRLEPVRLETGPMIIDSGFRCPKHNAAVGGKTNSAHLIGLAADIQCTNDPHRFTLIKSLLEHGFLRLGVDENDIHADIAPRPGPCIWTYYTPDNR
jgi:hypothetical protein